MSAPPIDPDLRYRKKGGHRRELLIPKRPARSGVRPDAWIFLNQAEQATHCYGPEEVTVQKKRKGRKESG